MATLLHVLQHGIDLANVRALAAAEEYARRLAQRGVPIAALLRAYRIGSARFQDRCLEELGALHGRDFLGGQLRRNARSAPGQAG